MTLARTKPDGTLQRRSATRKSAPIASTARPTGLTEMVGTRQGQNAVLTRANSSEGASRACYYATL